MLILAGASRADNSIDMDYSVLKCPDLNSQEEIDLDKVCDFLIFFPRPWRFMVSFFLDLGIDSGGLWGSRLAAIFLGGILGVPLTVVKLATGRKGS